MHRREFITGVGAAAAPAVWPLAARAQTPARPIIGILDWNNFRPGPDGPAMIAFREELAALGYVENQNVTIEFRNASGQSALLPALAADLVRHQVAVIVAVSVDDAALAAKRATSTIPTVFEYSGDPVRDGIVASLNRPGGNVTGIITFNSELGGKRLSLLDYLVPQTKRIAFLSLRQEGGQNAQILESARALGRQVIILSPRFNGDYEQVFETLVQSRAEALIVGNFTFRNRDRIRALAARYKIPTIYPSRGDVAAGGLMSYASAELVIFQLIGNYTGRILKGEKPADLPVQLPTRFEFVINMQTARALGLNIPPTLLALADDVIE
jgi:putative tryptophan/tyrosine transport system substrate-binding protein